MFFKANTNTVLLVQGSAYNLDTATTDGNEHGDSETQLPIGVWTTLTVVAKGTEVDMYFNGTKTLKLTTNDQTRHPHDNTMVYISDPWCAPHNCKFNACFAINIIRTAVVHPP